MVVIFFSIHECTETNKSKPALVPLDRERKRDGDAHHPHLNTRGHHSLSKQAPTISLYSPAELTRLKEAIGKTGKLLLGWVASEVDALGDVALEALHASLEKSLLALVEVGQGVQGLLGSVGLGVR